MNIAVLTGRLTADPELKTTNTGKNFVNFTLAVDKFANGEKSADFIFCEAWDRPADKLCQYKRKGDLIGVTGPIRTSRYTAQDGSARFKTYVLAVNIEFLGSRQEQPKQTAEPVFDPMPEDDLPF